MLLLLAACALTWDKVDWRDTGETTPCVTDDDCAVSTSCCDKTFYCHAAGESPTVCTLGCPVPRESACRCDDGACTFE